MSSEMRPSLRLLSSGASRSVLPGERWRGVAEATGGADLLLVLRRFSNWARREETGLMDEPSMFCSSLLSIVWAFLVSQHQVGCYSCSSTTRDCFPLGADGGVGCVVCRGPILGDHAMRRCEWAEGKAGDAREARVCGKIDCVVLLWWWWSNARRVCSLWAGTRILWLLRMLDGQGTGESAGGRGRCFQQWPADASGSRGG